MTANSVITNIVRGFYESLECNKFPSPIWHGYTVTKETTTEKIERGVNPGGPLSQRKRQFFFKNLKILPGIGRLEKFTGNFKINIGTLQEIFQTRTQFLLREVSSSSRTWSARE